MNINNLHIFHVGQTEASSSDFEEISTESSATSTENASAEAPAMPPQSPFGSLGSFLPIVLIIAIFYFIMIRPAQRKEKERKKEINEMIAGSKILFGGGIIGTITEVRSATFMVGISNNVTIEVAKGAVQRVIKDGEIPSTETN